MKQQVRLITPPAMFLLDERVFMSLGILHVAAVLEQQGYGVEMLRRKAHCHGIKVKALMSAGYPGESEQTIRETYEWLLAVRLDDFDGRQSLCIPELPTMTTRLKSVRGRGLGLQGQWRPALQLRPRPYSRRRLLKKGTGNGL